MLLTSTVGRPTSNWKEVMLAHNKRLQYTVRVSKSNAGLAKLMPGQFGGPEGELAAATRYFTQPIDNKPGAGDKVH